MAQVLTYIRVSATKHRRSDFGLKEQRAALSRFAAAEGFEIVREYLDIERHGGERHGGPESFDHRPQLRRALARAKWLNVPVIVASLDLLSRDSVFLAALMSRRIQFIVAGMGGDAVPFAVGPYRAMAKADGSSAARPPNEENGGAANAGGGRPGNPRLAHARKNASAVLRSKADLHANSVEPYIREARAAGCASFRRIAEYLTAHGVQTALGGTWSAKQVSNIMARIEPNLKKFLDTEGRVEKLPKSKTARDDILKFLWQKFEPGEVYSEAEVNELINRWHSFDDHCLLRRELFESGLLKRTRDCKTYWV